MTLTDAQAKQCAQKLLKKRLSVYASTYSIAAALGIEVDEMLENNKDKILYEFYVLVSTANTLYSALDTLYCEHQLRRTS